MRNWISARRGLADTRSTCSIRSTREAELERQALEAADAVIAVTPDALAEYAACYPHCAAKFHLITNGVDLEDFYNEAAGTGNGHASGCRGGTPDKEADADATATDFSDDGRDSTPVNGCGAATDISDIANDSTPIKRSDDAGVSTPIKRFVVRYCGSLGGENRSPEPLFRAFATLLGCEAVDAGVCELHFPAAMPQRFWELGESLGLGAALRRDEVVDRGAYVRRLRGSSVLLSINYHDQTTLVPGKLYEYWAAGRPILLLERPGAATDLVRRYDLGLAADVEDPKAVFDALWELWRRWRDDEPFHLRTAGLAAFSREGLAESLCALFERAARAHAPAAGRHTSDV